MHCVVCQLVLGVLRVHEGVVDRDDLFGDGVVDVVKVEGMRAPGKVCSALASPTRLAVGIRERRAEDKAADAAEPVCGRAEIQVGQV